MIQTRTQGCFRMRGAKCPSHQFDVLPEWSLSKRKMTQTGTIFPNPAGLGRCILFFSAGTKTHVRQNPWNTPLHIDMEPKRWGQFPKEVSSAENFAMWAFLAPCAPQINIEPRGGCRLAHASPPPPRAGPNSCTGTEQNKSTRLTSETRNPSPWEIPLLFGRALFKSCSPHLVGAKRNQKQTNHFCGGPPKEDTAMWGVGSR